MRLVGLGQVDEERDQAVTMPRRSRKHEVAAYASAEHLYQHGLAEGFGGRRATRLSQVNEALTGAIQCSLLMWRLGTGILVRAEQSEKQMIARVGRAYSKAAIIRTGHLRDSCSQLRWSQH
jgi:hypothetical protein